jgi:hypothetical protein
MRKTRVGEMQSKAKGCCQVLRLIKARNRISLRVFEGFSYLTFMHVYNKVLLSYFTNFKNIEPLTEHSPAYSFRL